MLSTTRASFALALISALLVAWPATTHAQQPAPAGMAQLQAENARLTAEVGRLTAEIGRLTAELNARTTPVAGRPVSATGIDRTKFDKVYAAAKAAQQAMYDTISRREWDALLRTLHTEASMAGDKASNTAEGNLASKYSTAALWLETGAISPNAAQRSDAWKKATETLDAANELYLGK